MISALFQPVFSAVGTFCGMAIIASARRKDSSRPSTASSRYCTRVRMRSRFHLGQLFRWHVEHHLPIDRLDPCADHAHRLVMKASRETSRSAPAGPPPSPAQHRSSRRTPPRPQSPAPVPTAIRRASGPRPAALHRVSVSWGHRPAPPFPFPPSLRRVQLAPATVRRGVRHNPARCGPAIRAQGHPLVDKQSDHFHIAAMDGRNQRRLTGSVRRCRRAVPRLRPLPAADLHGHFQRRFAVACFEIGIGTLAEQELIHTASRRCAAMCRAVSPLVISRELTSTLPGCASNSFTLPPSRSLTASRNSYPSRLRWAFAGAAIASAAAPRIA